MGLSPELFIPSRSPRLPWSACLSAVSVVKCLTRPYSGLSVCQNQHAICTSELYRADPKISVYPDADILMSNGQSSWDALLVAGQNSEMHSELQSWQGHRDRHSYASCFQISEMELQGWITYLTSLGLASRYSVCCLGTSGLYQRNASTCVKWPQLPEL